MGISSNTRALLDELESSLSTDLDSISGAWDGKNGGKLEEQANLADDAGTLLANLVNLVGELE